MVEETPDEFDQQASSSNAVAGFEDVELLLAEHGLVDEHASSSLGPDEEWEESEAAEVLAASWKNKRAELSKLQKSRRFNQANDLRRAFRVEVEEVKKRSKCFKCNKLGHFARECKARGASSASTVSAGTSGKDHAAGMVSVVTDEKEHFICSAGYELECEHATCHDVCLVSSPGFAVLDSGCGKTIVGEDTLHDFHCIWKAHGVRVPAERAETNTFKFGNGEREVSHRMIDMPVYIAGRRGVVRAAVVRGSAPLLLSRAALKTLQAHMNFDRDELTLFGTETVPMLVNEAGQYTVNVSKFPGHSPINADSVAPRVLSADASDDSDESHGVTLHCQPGTDAPPCHSVKVNKHRDKVKDYWEVRPKDRLVVRHHVKPRRARFTPCHTQCPIDVKHLMSHRVTHVMPMNDETEYQVCDQWTDSVDAHRIQHGAEWKGRTVFAIQPDADLTCFEAFTENEVCLTQWTPKQHRQLLSQIRQGEVTKDVTKVNVVEVDKPSLETCSPG